MKLERYGIALTCEGMGDCLYSMPVIKKLYLATRQSRIYDIFTRHPDLFKSCPYVDRVYPFADGPLIRGYQASEKLIQLFDLKAMQHWAVDTTDFVSLPTGMGQLSFREKQLEYFPTEKDAAESFDVVLNTSETWPSRSWPMQHWQRLADELAARGLSVAVVGKDVMSALDGMTKRSLPLQGCRNLINALSLDQTYFTIAKSRLFVSNQNGLSVLAGATDVEMIVLDMSIEWSKRAM
jgi:ADP-heptose:LPS heptosyltransferase